MGRPKIGAVSYLNTKPLVAGLEQDAPQFELVFDLPSRLADRLAAGELDVALIPIVEAIANPDYTVVSDACIACRGPVWSVKLLSRVPAEEIKTLALDEGSRTSCALARVLLDRKFDVRPVCSQLPIEKDWRATETDAVLIIGDRAMKADAPEFPHVWDLGEAWHQWTGKPFVFAVWVAAARNSFADGPASNLDQLDRVLGAARDRGLSEIKRICADHAAGYDLAEDECLRYLRDNLHFNLDAEEKSGIELFFQFASELSLIPQPIPLQFHDCQTAG